MAAVDPSHFKALYKYFPELTENQAINVLLFSMGKKLEDIADMRGVAPATIKKGLHSAQEKLDLQSLNMLRTVASNRIMIPYLVSILS